VIFTASLRFNLDPYNEYSDAQLWDALESVELKAYVMSLPGKLSELIPERGDGLSVGQRQLICIARALLRKPKILVLDEATASIDNETDSMIQRLVRKQFKDATVLTIAHRLHTIVDSDRILVLDNGSIAEFDNAENLLAKPDGIFKSAWEHHQEALRGKDTSENTTQNTTENTRSTATSAESRGITTTTNPETKL
jgi:ATP-binding cassette, subfamily C (CFTR/MRP), member 1